MPDISNQVAELLVRYEQWCESEQDSDVESFIATQALDETLVQALRDHLDNERDLNGLLQTNRSTAMRAEGTEALGPDSASPFEELLDNQPRMFGDYELEEILGQGGMGVVWRASENASGKRVVAIKMIRPGFATDEFLRRFEAECRTLELMDHQNIAQVYEAGAVGGVPYLTMEFVNGPTITEFCRPLNLTQRIEMFIHLGRAIQHAHERGVLHRDLKPSNVLVAQSDQGPVVKVIDFGLAKARQTDANSSELTNSLFAVGTPLWMSPEQASGRTAKSLAIDRRTDVYSLGVILYQLLTSTTPIAADRVEGLKPAELLQLVLEYQPTRPSRRRAELPDTDGQEFEFGSELDWIVLKALEKDRERRYPTVQALISDLENYLAGKPVVARAPSLTYRAHRFARRRWKAVLAIVAAGVLIPILLSLGRWSSPAPDPTIEAAKIRLEQEVLRQIEVGSWQEALNGADEFVEKFEESTEPIRLARLDALAGLSKTDQLQLEVDSLLADARKPTPELRLWQAYLTQISPNSELSPEEILTPKVIEQLEPADRAYAAGMLAEPAEGISHYEQAVNLESTHYRARVDWIAALILLGRTAAALDQIDKAESFWKKDPQFPLLRVFAMELANFSERDRGEAMGKLRTRFPELDLEPISLMIEPVRKLNQTLASDFQGFGFEDALVIYRLYARSLTGRFGNRTAENDLGTARLIRFRPTYDQAFNQVVGIANPSLLFLPEDQMQARIAEKMKSAFEIQPDALFKLFEAHASGGTFLEWAELYELAANSDSLFPEAQRQAWCWLGFSLSSHFAAESKSDGQPQQIWMDRAMEAYKVYCERPGYISDHRKQLLIRSAVWDQNWDSPGYFVERFSRESGDTEPWLRMVLDAAHRTRRHYMELEAVNRLLLLHPNDDTLITRRQDILRDIGNVP